MASKLLHTPSIVASKGLQEVDGMSADTDSKLEACAVSDPDSVGEDTNSPADPYGTPALPTASTGDVRKRGKY